MLASISTVVKGEMEEHLEAIVRRMMETLTSEEGVMVLFFAVSVMATVISSLWCCRFTTLRFK